VLQIAPFDVSQICGQHVIVFNYTSSCILRPFELVILDTFVISKTPTHLIVSDL
jgi:hypothetical protein